MAQLQPAQPGAGQASDVPVQPASGTDRHVRSCDACGQVDDHPRHLIYDPANNGDTTRHLDCCAAAGCESCAEQLAAAPETARHGQSLIDHLTGEA